MKLCCSIIRDADLTCFSIREFRKQVKISEQKSAARRPQKLILSNKGSQDRTACITSDVREKSRTPPVDGQKKAPAEPIVIDD